MTFFLFFTPFFISFITFLHFSVPKNSDPGHHSCFHFSVRRSSERIKNELPSKKKNSSVFCFQRKKRRFDNCFCFLLVLFCFFFHNLIIRSFSSENGSAIQSTYFPVIITIIPNNAERARRSSQRYRSY